MLQWWLNMSGARKAGFAAGLVGIAALAAGLAYLALHHAYVPLFKDSEPQENASVVAQLESLAADYRVDDGTGLVMVPQERVESLRAALMQRGVMFKSPKGFELFDNSDFGMTEFSQRINYQRGLEGELAQTIMALDGVRYARLHLVLPDAGLFQRDREQPKASVTLLTSAGKSLSADRITGIRRLVASAVPGLKPEMVSVLDHRGVDLAGKGESDGGSAVDERVRAKVEMESYLAEKVRDAMASLFQGGAAVSVNVELRMDRVTAVQQEEFAGRPAAKPVPVRADAGSADGSEAKRPIPPSNPADTDTRSSKIERRIEELPGAIERLSVGVIVPVADASRFNADPLRELIASTVGADLGRGDRIAVYPVDAAIGVARTVIPEAVSGTRPSQAQPATSVPAGTDASWNRRAAWLGAVVVLMLTVGLALLLWLKRPSRLSNEEREVLLEKVREWLRKDAQAPGSL